MYSVYYHVVSLETMLEDHLKITVAAEYGRVLTDVTAILYFHFQWQLAALKMLFLLVCPKTELSFNFFRDASFTLL